MTLGDRSLRKKVLEEHRRIRTCVGPACKGPGCEGRGCGPGCIPSKQHAAPTLSPCAVKNSAGAVTGTAREPLMTQHRSCFSQLRVHGSGPGHSFLHILVKHPAWHANAPRIAPLLRRACMDVCSSHTLPKARLPHAAMACLGTTVWVHTWPQLGMHRDMSMGMSMGPGCPVSGSWRSSCRA